jgi:hypothetical protein
MIQEHTPESAARAIRALFEGRIAVTWDHYFEQAQELKALAPARRPFGGAWLTSYHAAKLVQEQCNGPSRELPISFEAAATALANVIPELFAEYWMTLPVGEAKAIAA